MGNRQIQLYKIIRLMCHTHGEVNGVRALSSALGQTYQSVYNRVGRLEARGLIVVDRPGKGGTPARISLS